MKGKLTKDQLNYALAVGIGGLRIIAEPGKKPGFQFPDYCKIFGITDDKIKEMNKAMKKEAQKNKLSNGKKQVRNPKKH